MHVYGGVERCGGGGGGGGVKYVLRAFWFSHSTKLSFLLHICFSYHAVHLDRWSPTSSLSLNVQLLSHVMISSSASLVVPLEANKPLLHHQESTSAWANLPLLGQELVLVMMFRRMQSVQPSASSCLDEGQERGYKIVFVVVDIGSWEKMLIDCLFLIRLFAKINKGIH